MASALPPVPQLWGWGAAKADPLHGGMGRPLVGNAAKCEDKTNTSPPRARRVPPSPRTYSSPEKEANEGEMRWSFFFLCVVGCGGGVGFRGISSPYWIPPPPPPLHTRTPHAAEEEEHPPRRTAKKAEGRRAVPEEANPSPPSPFQFRFVRLPHPTPKTRKRKRRRKTQTKRRMGHRKVPPDASTARLRLRRLFASAAVEKEIERYSVIRAAGRRWWGGGP